MKTTVFISGSQRGWDISIQFGLVGLPCKEAIAPGYTINMEIFGSGGPIKVRNVHLDQKRGRTIQCTGEFSMLQKLAKQGKANHGSIEWYKIPSQNWKLQ